MELNSELKYFKPHEFQMGGVNVYERMSTFFLIKMDNLREAVGFPLIPTSTFRDEEYNRKKGGARNSMHLKGRAMDVRTYHLTGSQRVELMSKALDLGLTVIVEKNVWHFDDRKDQTVSMFAHK